MKEKARQLSARVRETVQTAQKLLGEEESQVRERARELSAKVRERMQSAQKQILGFEEEVQKFVGMVQEKLLATPIEQVRKLDDLLKALVVKDFVEKIKAIEMFKQGQEVRRDLLERFGLVDAEEVARLTAALEAVRKDVAALKTRVAGLVRKPAAQKTPAPKAAPAPAPKAAPAAKKTPAPKGKKKA